MRICRDCAEAFAQKLESGPFPGLTLLGTAAGAIGTAFTGLPVILPLGALAGFGGDLAVCERCGQETDELVDTPQDPMHEDEFALKAPRVPEPKGREPFDIDSPDSLSWADPTRDACPFPSRDTGPDDGGSAPDASSLPGAFEGAGASGDGVGDGASDGGDASFGGEGGDGGGGFGGDGAGFGGGV